MKSIGKVELFTIALGSVIGWGAFMLPGNFFLKNAGVINTTIGFLIAIIMIAFIEKSYSKLMGRYNESGGEYTYAKKTFGDITGFYTGWLLLLAYISIIPLNATAIPMVFERILPTIYSKGILLYTIAEFPVYLNDLIVSCLFIVFFTVIQIKGIKSSSKMQNIAVFSLLGCVLFLSIFAILNIDERAVSNLNSNLGDFDIDLIVRIIAFAPWAFIGFDTIAQLTSESKTSPKKASLMALIAVIFGGLIYNAINLITALGIENSTIISTGWATGDAVFNLFGDFALYILGFAMFGAVLSGLNGFFMSSTRLTYSMFGIKENSVSQVNLTKVTLFISAVSLTVPFFGRNALMWFVDISSVGASFAYLLTCSAAYKLSSNYTEKLISSVGVIFSLSFLLFLLTPFFGSNIPVVSGMVLIIWVILGSAYYFIKGKKPKLATSNT